MLFVSSIKNDRINYAQWSFYLISNNIAKDKILTEKKLAQGYFLLEKEGKESQKIPVYQEDTNKYLSFSSLVSLPLREVHILVMQGVFLK